VNSVRKQLELFVIDNVLGVVPGLHNHVETLLEHLNPPGQTHGSKHFQGFLHVLEYLVKGFIEDSLEVLFFAFILPLFEMSPHIAKVQGCATHGAGWFCFGFLVPILDTLVAERVTTDELATTGAVRIADGALHWDEDVV